MMQGFDSMYDIIFWEDKIAIWQVGFSYLWECTRKRSSAEEAVGIDGDCVREVTCLSAIWLTSITYYSIVFK